MILDYIADMIGLKAKEKGIELIFDIDHEVRANFLGDPLRISQIILNMMSNAIKFTEIGSVSVKVHSHDVDERRTRLQFEVKDTGIGLTQAQINSLFQSYTQADAATSRKYGGTGLGLTISKQLTELMNGQIWVESTYKEGCTFFINLELEYEKPHEFRVYHLPSKEIMQKRILIIDSHENTTNALTNMLGYFHMNVHSVDNEQDARLAMNRQEYDIVFVDDEISEFNQFQLCVKENPPLIVLIQNWINDYDEEYYAERCIDAFIKRPFNQQMLFDTIVRLYSDDKTISHVQKRQYVKDDIKALGRHEILIAEDNIINQKVMKGLLSDTALELVFADDGEIALDKLSHKNDFSLILMDIHMPKLDGYETSRKIQENEDYRNIPIVAMTADAMPEDVKKAKEYGMQDHISKPIDIQSLYETLITYLKTNSDDLDDITHKLHEVPELDYINTMKYTGNDPYLYQSILEDFVSMYSDSHTKMSGYITSQEYAKGEYYARELKEAASNIGAKKLFKYARILENSFENRYYALLLKYEEEYRKSLNTFIEAMNKLLDIKK